MGDLYPCHQFVGEDAYKLAHLGRCDEHRRSGWNSKPATHTHAPNVLTAGQNFTARAAAPQMRIMPPVLSAAFMNTAANCLKSALNALIMMQVKKATDDENTDC